MRAVAVDWSGAAETAAQRRHIWMAEAVDGELIGLGAGRTREETVDELLRVVDGGAIVGLDFGFSLPGWFARSHGCVSGPDVWEVARTLGPTWLERCPPPFWGRAARLRPPADPERSAWRRTELTDGAGMRRPKSVFQIGGIGSVGTGSVRGMTALARLRSAGMAVWPFDPPDGPGVTVAEVYPRWCTGPVVKSDAHARRVLVRQRWARMPRRFVDAVTASEDAFDAACTALVMSEWERGDGEPVDEVDRLEGRILHGYVPTVPSPVNRST